MSAAMWAAESNRRWAAQAALLALTGLTLAACAGGPSPSPAPVTGPIAGPGTGGAGTQGQPSSRYSGYRVGQPYQVRGVWYYPKEQPDYDQIGIASWYGEAFHNHYTADGEVFDMTLPSAAHTTLPLPSLVEVTNLANGRTLIVRVNDRGPFVDGRVIDLSKEAAAELGFVTAGVTRVRVRYVGRAADPGGMSARTQVAAAPKAPAGAATAQVALADAGGPRRMADYDYASAPKRPIPYSQLAQAQPAPAPVATAASSTAAAAAAAPFADVDTLLGSAPSARVIRTTAPVTYELQAGTFTSEDAARRFASGLTGGGLPEVQTVREGTRISYQVVVHGLAGPTEAAAARSEAMALGAPRALIVGGS